MNIYTNLPVNSWVKRQNTGKFDWENTGFSIHHIQADSTQGELADPTKGFVTVLPIEDMVEFDTAYGHLVDKTHQELYNIVYSKDQGQYGQQQLFFTKIDDAQKAVIVQEIQDNLPPPAPDTQSLVNVAVRGVED